VYIVRCINIITEFGKWLRKYRLHLYPRHRGNNISIERVRVICVYIYITSSHVHGGERRDVRIHNIYRYASQYYIIGTDNGAAKRKISNKNNNKSTFCVYVFIYIYVIYKESGGRCLKVGGTIGPYHAPLDRPRR